MVSVFINRNKFNILKNFTVLQACSSQGIDIPRFCFHEKLSIAGNCRMCLVEIKGSLKPVASCAFPVSANMEILTNTLLVKRARESVLEFLLINHPLDCPICDQGGECDLQDQVMVYGSDRGRFYEEKRAVSNKDLGPIIKSLMTRCIHCTRCVRFISEIVGNSVIGMTGRGLKSEISTYINSFIKSELSGNLADICPVGALTSKQLAFKARSWELRSTYSIDFFDSLCSNTIIESRGSDIMRIMPRPNDLLNEDWISDKARYSFDGLKIQRISYPLWRNNQLDEFIILSWEKVFLNSLKRLEKLDSKNSLCVVGEINDLETLLAFKKLANNLLESSDFLITKDINNISNDFRKNWSLNEKLININKSDMIFLVGMNPRIESPILNIRIRRMFLLNKALIFVFGFSYNLGYFFSLSSLNMTIVINFFEGKTLFNRLVATSNYPIFLFGESYLRRLDSISVLFFQKFWKLILNFASKFNFIKNWEMINFVHNYTGILNARELGITTNYNNLIVRSLNPYNCFYILNSKNFDLSNFFINKKSNSFLIYQGHHGDSALNLYYNVILPGSTNFEKTGTFMNFENKFFRSRFIINPPFEAREDWKIFMSFLLLNKQVSSILDLTLLDLHKSLYNLVPVNFSKVLFSSKEVLGLTSLASFFTYFFKTTIDSTYNCFYQSDTISSASLIMSLCKTKLSNKSNFIY